MASAMKAVKGLHDVAGSVAEENAAINRGLPNAFRAIEDIAIFALQVRMMLAKITAGEGQIFDFATRLACKSSLENGELLMLCVRKIVNSHTNAGLGPMLDAAELTAAELTESTNNLTFSLKRAPELSSLDPSLCPHDGAWATVYRNIHSDVSKFDQVVELTQDALKGLRSNLARAAGCELDEATTDVSGHVTDPGLPRESVDVAHNEFGLLPRQPSTRLEVLSTFAARGARCFHFTEAHCFFKA